mgnify:CR=1 FL=1
MTDSLRIAIPVRNLLPRVLEHVRAGFQRSSRTAPQDKVEKARKMR